MPPETTQALFASDSLTPQEIGEAMYVHRVLGFGYSEKICQAALGKKLTKAGILFENEKPLSVFFEGELVGSFVADMAVEGRVLLELKSVASLLAAYEVQLISYLTTTKIGDGLPINFGPKSLEVKRRVLGYVPVALREESPIYSSPHNL